MKETRFIKPVLTIGVPVYNASGYLEDLLDELSKIDSNSVEIILVDDGSKDNSLSICKKYQSDIIHVFHQNNLGPSGARNRIIELSHGDWISFVDADDLINSSEYCSLLPLLDGASDWYINIADKSVYNTFANKRKISAILSALIEKEIINSPCNKFYKLDILRQKSVAFVNGISIGEDLLFNVEYSKKCNEIGFINKEIYTIRNNPNSLTKRIGIEKYNELMLVNDKCCELYSNNEEIINSFVYIRIKNCLSCLKDYKHLDNDCRKEFLKKVGMTSIPDRVFLNNIKTSLIYWGWKIVPKKIMVKLL